jgi:hypothetical protein
MEQENSSSPASGFRAYADFLEQHPNFPSDAEISTYCMRDMATIRELLENGFGIEKCAQIVYLRRSFGVLRVKHVISIEVMYSPAIVDGKVEWALKPEFECATSVEVAPVATSEDGFSF